MTEQAEKPSTAAQGSKPGGAPGKGGFFTDWVVPIGLGLAIGSVAVWAWPRVMHKPARRIVTEARAQDIDDLTSFEERLRALGAGARDDLVAAMASLDPLDMDGKIWIAGLLTGDPWFATVSLKEVAKDGGSAADRRAAACALVDAQSKEVDPELVLPIFEEWLKDTRLTDHGYVLGRLDRMSRLGMFGEQWEKRLKTAVIGLVRKDRPVGKDEDPDLVAEDRSAAIQALGTWLPDDEAKKVLWTVALDEADGAGERLSAVRALAENKLPIDSASAPDWAKIAESANVTVRQTAADGLHRAKGPEYDKILEKLQYDAAPFVRSGALDSQIERGSPTMFERFDEFLEDSEEAVRFNALIALGTFTKVTEGQARRAAMAARVLASSDSENDVTAAAIAFKLLTDKVYGFQPLDVHVVERFVEETALSSFMADKAGRKAAAEKWLAEFGNDAVWTDADRAKTLEKLLKHPDPLNVERARAELDKLHK